MGDTAAASATSSGQTPSEGPPVLNPRSPALSGDDTYAEVAKRALAPAGSADPRPARGLRDSGPEEGAQSPGGFSFGVLPLRGPIPVDQLERLAGGLSVLSLVLIALGVVAVAAPLLFSLVIEQFLGVLFMLGGIVQLVHGLQLCGGSAPGCSMNMLMGGLNLFTGTWLVTSPVEGLAGLTLLIAAWFFASGVSKLVMTFQVRHLSTWPSVLVSGLLSLLLAVMILGQWPESAAWVVGVLVGVDFVVTGAALGSLACMAHLGRRTDVGSAEPLLQGEQAA